MNSQKVMENEKKYFLMENFCLECILLFFKNYMIVFLKITS